MTVTTSKDVAITVREDVRAKARKINPFLHFLSYKTVTSLHSNRSSVPRVLQFRDSTQQLSRHKTLKLELHKTQLHSFKEKKSRLLFYYNNLVF